MKFGKPGRRSRRLSRDEEIALRQVYARAAAYEGLPFPRKTQDSHFARLEWSAVRFAILTGCRRMEQLQLSRRSVEELPSGPLLHIRDRKAGPRTIPLHPEAHSIAAEWLAQPRLEASEWIFWPSQVDKRFDFGPWHYNKVSRLCARLRGWSTFTGTICAARLLVAN